MAVFNTAPIVVGGIYRRRLPSPKGDGSPRYEYATCVAAEELHNGALQGRLVRASHDSLIVRENTDLMAGWDLVGRPTISDVFVPSSPQRPLETARGPRAG